MTTKRLYGVSSGDGNNGVSHMFPDYYVKTDDPWNLVRLAALSALKANEGVRWAKQHMEIDGDEEWCVAATFYEGPDGETAFGAAWFVIEVFPEDEPREGKWIYRSLTAAFGKDFVRRHKER